MAALNVNPADLLTAAEDYGELAARAAAISPRLAAEATRVIESHGPMGYPVAVGVVAGLVGPDARVAAKAQQFGQYAQRFAEHAATYQTVDRQAAARYTTPATEAAAAEAMAPNANVGPDLPPAGPTETFCWIGTAGGDAGALCPANTDTVFYVDGDGNYVKKDLHTGEVTIAYEPGPMPEYPQGCWLPSAGADRSICGPDTTVWLYPQGENLIEESRNGDNGTITTRRIPPGRLDPF